MIKGDARKKVADLVSKFQRDSNRQQSEADVRAGYIDLLFAALGWNVYNDPGQLTNYRREGYIRGAGYVDVGLEIRAKPEIFLEAKRFGVIPVSTQRSGDRSTEEKQAFRYARGRKIAYAVLTNFERLHLFNADQERLILVFDSPRDYLQRFDELWRLSPNEVERGSLPWWEGQLEKRDVDLEFLGALRRWRLLIANAIYHQNGTNPVLQGGGNVDFQRLMEAVQRILDRLILIRYADDKEVLLAHDLLETTLVEYRNRGAYARPDHLMRSFIDLSHMMDEHHNTTLFAPDHVCEQVVVSNDVFGQVIEEMSGISFRKFTSDILGNTYESYLGTKLTLRNNQIVDEERRDIRRGRGIYYTPRWVVEYIVDNTLGRQLRQLEEEYGLHAIEQVRGLAILDPACGSGSFLIYAYHVLANFYRRLNQTIVDEQARLVADLADPDMFQRLERLQHLPQPVPDYPETILKEHLYGVDLDAEAAEIAAVNLTMQAFADSRHHKLPLILNENIKVGNSLITGTEEELRSYFGDQWKDKRSFNWDEGFPEVMARGGFDVVLGNPPYDVLATRELGYDVSPDLGYYKSTPTYVPAIRGKTNLYKLFICRGVSLTRKGGIFSFIVPMALLGDDQARGVRQLLLEKTRLLAFECFPQKDDPRERVFSQAKLSTAVFVTSRLPVADHFLVRTHPGRSIEESSEQLRLTPADILAFDPENMAIPSCTERDWHIAVGILAGGVMRLGRVAKLNQGEVNETTCRDLLPTDGDGPAVLRGASISLYATREPSQGVVRHLDVQAFLKGKLRDSKAWDHSHVRIGLQRSSPQNNFRRLIAAPILPGEFCFDTVSYVTHESSTLDLNLLLALLNSKILDWYFRLGSTNSKVNEYQFNNLPIPSIRQDGPQLNWQQLSERDRWSEVVNLAGC